MVMTVPGLATSEEIFATPTQYPAPFGVNAPAVHVVVRVPNGVNPPMHAREHESPEIVCAGQFPTVIADATVTCGCRQGFALHAPMMVVYTLAEHVTFNTPPSESVYPGLQAK
jgi:hypothetical protein